MRVVVERGRLPQVIEPLRDVRQRDASLQQLVARKCRMSCNRKRRNPAASSVSRNDFGATRRRPTRLRSRSGRRSSAMRESIALVNQGCRRIAFLGPPLSRDPFRRGLASKGQEPVFEGLFPFGDPAPAISAFAARNVDCVYLGALERASGPSSTPPTVPVYNSATATSTPTRS